MKTSSDDGGSWGSVPGAGVFADVGDPSDRLREGRTKFRAIPLMGTRSAMMASSSVLENPVGRGEVRVLASLIGQAHCSGSHDGEDRSPLENSGRERSWVSSTRHSPRFQVRWSSSTCASGPCSL